MSKNLLANPIKLSQPAGAALAFMGIKGAIPLWHGVQGCTAFAKILLIQHFREPMPFQTTALTQPAVIMGGDENIVEALDVIKKDASFLGLLTTGVVETSGVDLAGIVKKYRNENADVTIVPVNTPDYEGSFETGYAKACTAVLEEIAKPKRNSKKKQAALFIGPYVTPGEVEELRDTFMAFGLKPVIFPDLGDSLYGYVTDENFSPCSIGGTPVEEIKTLADSAFVVSVGLSMKKLADRFAVDNRLPVFCFDHLSTMDELDKFFSFLETQSGMPVPEKFRKQRKHLQDTLLDSHFYFHEKRAVLAGDPDFIARWAPPLEEMGVPITAVSSVPFESYPQGDLEDLREIVEDTGADFFIGNSHVAELAEKLSVPVVRSGIPVYDRMGEPQSVRLGYAGTARLYMECANALMSAQSVKNVYISNLQKTLR